MVLVKKVRKIKCFCESETRAERVEILSRKQLAVKVRHLGYESLNMHSGLLKDLKVGN